MATFNVKTSVTAPAEITIPLVRADQAETSNIFRIVFEVFLSLFSTMLGYVLALEKPSNFHWVILAGCLIFCVVFLCISMYFTRKSKNIS